MESNGNNNWRDKLNEDMNIFEVYSGEDEQNLSPEVRKTISDYPETPAFLVRKEFNDVPQPPQRSQESPKGAESSPKGVTEVVNLSDYRREGGGLEQPQDSPKEPEFKLNLKQMESKESQISLPKIQIDLVESRSNSSLQFEKSSPDVHGFEDSGQSEQKHVLSSFSKKLSSSNAHLSHQEEEDFPSSIGKELSVNHSEVKLHGANILSERKLQKRKSEQGSPSYQNHDSHGYRQRRNRSKSCKVTDEEFNKKRPILKKKKSWKKTKNVSKKKSKFSQLSKTGKIQKKSRFGMINEENNQPTANINLQEPESALSGMMVVESMESVRSKASNRSQSRKSGSKKSKGESQLTPFAKLWRSRHTRLSSNGGPNITFGTPKKASPSAQVRRDSKIKTVEFPDSDELLSIKKSFTQQKYKQVSSTTFPSHTLLPADSQNPKNISFFGRFIFNQFSHLFKHKAIKKADMNILPPEIRVEVLRDQVNHLVTKSKQGRSEEISSVTTIIYRMIGEPTYRAIILKCIEQVLILAQTALLIYFLKSIKAKVQIVEQPNILFYALAAGLIAFCRHMVKEHSKKAINECVSKSGQILRGVIFDKIISSNITFLRNADTSLITKIAIFQFDTMLEFIGSVPEIISFPLMLVLSFILISLSISYNALISLFVFFLIGLILVFLAKQLAIKNLKYEYSSSQRYLLVDELVQKIRDIKNSSMENFFKKQVKTLRNKEIEYLRAVFNLTAIANFMMSFSIIAGILLIIAIERTNKELGLTETISIISVISNFGKPLKKFVMIINQFYKYKVAADSLNNFVFNISDMPRHITQDCTLEPGQIICKDCTTEMEDDEEMAGIFGLLFVSKNRLNHIQNGYFGDLSEVEKEINLRKKKVLVPEISASQKRHRIVHFAVKNRKKKFRIRRRILNIELNISIQSGEKAVLLGSETSGKIEFLYSLIGETHISSGFIKLRGRVVFSDAFNVHFLEDESLKDNILMGSKYDPTRYKRVLRVTGINLSKFNGGEMVQVLKNAKNFSDPDARKILLARALYQRGDIYILHNYFGLSEFLDNNHLYYKFVQTYLKDKTVICTGSMQQWMVKNFEKVIYFEDGLAFDLNAENEIDFSLSQGLNPLSPSYSHLSMRSSMRFDSRCPSPHKSIVEICNESQCNNPQDRIRRRLKQQMGLRRDRTIDSMNTADLRSKLAGKSPFHKQGAKRLLKGAYQLFYNEIKNSARRIELGSRRELDELKHELDGEQIMNMLFKGFMKVKDKKEEGRVAHEWDESPLYTRLLRHLWHYVFVYAKWRVIFQILLFMMTTSLMLFNDMWMGAWSLDLFDLDNNSYLLMYVAITLMTLLAVLVRERWFYIVMMNTSNTIHSRMISSLLRIDIFWLTFHPKTRVSYKLSYDMKRVDQMYNALIQQSFDAFTMIIGGIVLTNYVFVGLYLVVYLIISVFVYRVAKKYVNATHTFIQYIAENSSIMQAVFNLTMNKALSFRVFSKLGLLERQFVRASNELQRVTTHLSCYSKRWLGTRMSLIYAVLTSTSYLLPLLFIQVHKGRLTNGQML